MYVNVGKYSIHAMGMLPVGQGAQTNLKLFRSCFHHQNAAKKTPLLHPINLVNGMIFMSGFMK